MKPLNTKINKEPKPQRENLRMKCTAHKPEEEVEKEQNRTGKKTDFDEMKLIQSREQH